FLEKNGISIDKQNRNPSRLSRMPGVTRNGNRQYLVATNIGRKSWVDWMDYVEGVTDELPDMEALSKYKDNPPALPEELISGILRRGHKMLVSGSSKAGKSFLLMELCVSIAEGKPWLGFPVKKGRVLYVNLEIDPASAINRFYKIYAALGLKPQHEEDILLWNLRGHAVPLDQLVPKLIRRVRDQRLDAIVIDPIYKVITGDENNASEMGAFCNQFDKICAETGCSTIYCHHHSKGVQGAKRAMDRASGSGVFARDPDAQLDMIQLELSDDIQNNVRDGSATAWRLESSLREFPNITPVNLWFDYPIHRIDSEGTLENSYAEGSPMANLSRSRKYTTREERRISIENAFAACNMGVPVTVKDLASYLGLTDRCVRDRLKEMDDLFWVHQGIVMKKAEDGKEE
nr:AAA family ATPase [Oscillospiraceae bacterium]